MQRKKIEFNLHGVPKTLLLPLYGRASVSRQYPERFYDEKAVQIMSSLDYNLDSITNDADLLKNFDWASDRAIYFDNEVKNFIARHPRATIVNIGAGLETAFYRIDNGQLNWVDLDVPEVIALRQQFLSPPKRVHYLNKSLLDYTWLNDVAKIGQPIFLFAGGVFIYFKEAEVKNTLLAMAKQLTGAQLVFDCIDYRDLDKGNDVLTKCDMPDAKFQWGFQLDEFITWSPKIKYIKHERYRLNPEPDQENRFARSYMVKVEFV